jgi:hypothetical protein
MMNSYGSFLRNRLWRADIRFRHGLHVRVSGSLSIRRLQSNITSTKAAPGQRSLNKNVKIKISSELPPLSIMPTWLLLRSLLIMSILASPRLLGLGILLMSRMAVTKTRILNPDRNPILHLIVRKTFYDHFAAGENIAEVQRTIATLEEMGHAGVILGYAVEADPGANLREENLNQTIEKWKEGNLQSLEMIKSDDFLAIK